MNRDLTQQQRRDRSSLYPEAKTTVGSAVRGMRRAEMPHALRVGRGVLVFCLRERGSEGEDE